MIFIVAGVLIAVLAVFVLLETRGFPARYEAAAARHASARGEPFPFTYDEVVKASAGRRARALLAIVSHAFGAGILLFAALVAFDNAEDLYEERAISGEGDPLWWSLVLLVAVVGAAFFAWRAVRSARGLGIEATMARMTRAE